MVENCYNKFAEEASSTQKQIKAYRDDGRKSLLYQNPQLSSSSGTMWKIVCKKKKNMKHQTRQTLANNL